MAAAAGALPDAPPRVGPRPRLDRGGPPTPPRHRAGPPGGGGGDGRSGGGPSGEKKPAKKRSFIWRWRRAFFLLALLGLVAVAAGGAVVARTELPTPDPLTQSTFICGAGVQPGDCTPQTSFAKIQGDEDRVNVTYDQLPQVLIDSVVAMEDRDFFSHSGVSPLGIARALYRDLRGDAVQQGGSTITQQYVKNTFLTSERSLTRKIREAILSIKVEQNYSKEEILEGYLNTIYFGRGAYGVQAASQAYFGRDVADIDLAQAAYLAGLIRAPVSADFTDNPDEAERRRHTALVAMEQEGYITSDEADFADAVPFDEAAGYRPFERRQAFQPTPAFRNMGGDYITQYVNGLLEEMGYSEEEIFGGGLRVYTSIDPGSQQRAWDAVHSVLPNPEDPAAALVAIDQNGFINAMVGGRGFEPGVSEVNYATRGRAVGSTFKPIALAEAVMQGWSLDSMFNAPGVMTIPGDQNPCGEDWEVNNYDESEQGELNLIDATRVSSNTAYAQLVAQVGTDRVDDLAHRMGIEGELSECLPVVLGSDNATPLEMATVFSTFANQGVRKSPQIITRVERLNEHGEAVLDWTATPQEETIMPPGKADLVTHALRSVVDSGTGEAAQIGRPAAGKTGTTSNNVDAWFVGYVPEMTASVWMGYANADWDDPEVEGNELFIPPMNDRGRPVQGRSVTGGSFPAQIWQRFMAAEVEARGFTEAFPELTPEQIEAGRDLDDVMEDGDDGGGDQPAVTQPPSTTAPPSSQTTMPPSTTESTEPPDTTPSTEPPTTGTSMTITVPTSPFPPTTDDPPGRD